MKALLSFIFAAFFLGSLGVPGIHALESGGAFSVVDDCGHSGSGDSETLGDGHRSGCADFIRNSASERMRSDSDAVLKPLAPSPSFAFAKFRFHPAVPTEVPRPRKIVRGNSPPAFVGIVKIQT